MEHEKAQHLNNLFHLNNSTQEGLTENNIILNVINNYNFLKDKNLLKNSIFIRLGGGIVSGVVHETNFDILPNIKPFYSIALIIIVSLVF